MPSGAQLPIPLSNKKAMDPMRRMGISVSDGRQSLATGPPTSEVTHPTLVTAAGPGAESTLGQPRLGSGPHSLPKSSPSPQQTGRRAGSRLGPQAAQPGRQFDHLGRDGLLAQAALIGLQGLFHVPDVLLRGGHGLQTRQVFAGMAVQHGLG